MVGGAEVEMPNAAGTSKPVAPSRLLPRRLPRQPPRRAAARPDSSWPEGLAKTLAATVAYALVHSALASRGAKARAARLAGERARNALYRPLFILQSTAGFLALGRYIRRLPNHTLWDLQGPAAWLARLAQAGCIATGISAARQVGIGRMLGWPGLKALIAGQREMLPEPEAQGPAIDPQRGIMLATGPFQYSRHPLNFVPIPVLWLNPRMTTNLAAFALAATLYFAIGSLHEEYRLREAYGPAYEEYRRSGVSFLLPG